jgi:hypothetical protein
MESSKEIFYNSYLKKLKRPELQREYNPDESYGANTLFRSEETNPWAGRDQSNAKFGALGGPSGYQGQPFKLSQGSTSGGVGGGDYTLGDILSHGKAGVNLPFIPSGEKSVFNTLMEPVIGAGSKLGANAIVNWMKPVDSFSKLSPMMEGFAGRATDAIPFSPAGDALSEMGGGYGKLADLLTKESSDTLKSTIAGTGEGATTGAAESSIPYAGAGLSLLGDTLSGKIIKDPLSSLGGAGGMLGGAALGSMLLPGIGTVLGGALGGGGGRLIGRLLRKIF